MKRAEEEPRLEPALAEEIVAQNIAFHQTQALLYDLAHPELTNLFQRVLLRRDIRKLRRLLSDVPQPLALDVGAGTGRLTLAFVRAGFEVWALDNSPAMLAVLQQRYERLRQPKGELRIIVRDAEGLEPSLVEGRLMHLIGFSSVLHHLPDYLSVLRKAMRLLAPGGCLYITHEPWPADVHCKTLMMRLAGLIDDLLRVPQQMRKYLWGALMKLPPPPPAPLMDYHDRQGLDFAALRRCLEEEGLTIVRLRRYKARKTTLMTLLDTYLLRTPNWRFTLLAQKRENEP